MKRAIVLGNGVSGLGVIWSLGQMGIKISSLYYEDNGFAQASRYVSEKVKIPHPQRQEKEFIDFLLENSGRWKGALMLETNDLLAVAISKHKAELSKYYKIVTPEWDITKTFIQKSETYKLAEVCDVPHPRTFLPKTIGELHNIKDEITYPSLLKPVGGHEFKNKFNSKGIQVNSHDELYSKFGICLQSGLEVMVQEIIPGPDSNLYKNTVYVNLDGNVGAEFCLRKKRQNPPRFGVARVAISEELIPEIKEYTERILKQANFKGFASAEFKLDPRDHKFKLIEINVRMIRPIWHSSFCGVNFPWIIYMDLVEGEKIEMMDYKKGVYWIDLYADVLNSILRNGKENLGIREYLRPYLAKEKTFAVQSRHDIKPFLRQIAILPIKYYKLFVRSNYD